MTIYLIATSGPAIDPIALKESPDPQIIGRHESCQIRLPASADQVSRMHARFRFENRSWRISDLGSRWGTFLNGHKLEPNREMTLSEGDLIRITPWTFAVSSKLTPRRAMLSDDDGATMQTMVRTVSVGAGISEEILKLLLECSSTLHSAEDEKKLAEVLMDAGIRGTGLANAVVLKPVDTSGKVEIVASKFAGEAGTGARFSRTLLATAANGQVAEISGVDAQAGSASIVAMKISSAICVPIVLGGSPAAFLYLDSRGQAFSNLRKHATGFCAALANIASLALANLKRIDIEKRQAEMEAELHAAGAAQKLILPPREIQFGRFKIMGESRPGAYVGGDFFDCVDLDDGKIAIVLGDVTGHGVEASVLMTAAQGFLHASLRQSKSAALAARDLNRFIHPRRPASKFITMWLGIFDLSSGTLEYVDAGHGYGMLCDPAGKVHPLSAGDAMPIGILEDTTFESTRIQLPGSGRALVISDGIVEQFDEMVGGVTGEQFGLQRVEAILHKTAQSGDPITTLFDSVTRHAKGQPLNDDATGVLVGW